MSTWSDYDYQNGEFRILCTQNREFWLSKPLAACFGSIWRILKKSKNLKFFFLLYLKYFPIAFGCHLIPQSGLFPFFLEKKMFFLAENTRKNRFLRPSRPYYRLWSKIKKIENKIENFFIFSAKNFFFWFAKNFFSWYLEVIYSPKSAIFRYFRK